MWAFVNRILNTAFDLWLWPFQALPAFWQLVALVEKLVQEAK